MNDTGINNVFRVWKSFLFSANSALMNEKKERIIFDVTIDSF